jgi:AcrR family transcriptional regulator
VPAPSSAGPTVDAPDAPDRTGAEAVEAVEGDTPGLRVRKKLETRQALVDAAIQLATSKGFDATTVDDIAAAVGVSARTFHRYFERKEDAVLADSGVRLSEFRTALDESAAAAPTVLAAVRHATVTSFSRRIEQPKERARNELVRTTPSLRAYNLSLYDRWASVITEHAAAAVGESPDDRWPTMFGLCAMAALTCATRRWSADPSLDFAAECDAALDLLAGMDRPVTAAPEQGSRR